MKTLILLTTLLGVTAAPLAQAAERYGDRPPVIVSPDLTAPWLTQLGTRKATPRGQVAVQQRGVQQRGVQPSEVRQRVVRQRAVPLFDRLMGRTVPTRQVVMGAPVVGQQVIGERPAGMRGRAMVQPVAMVRPQAPVHPLDPQFLPQTVAYPTSEKPGTIVIDTNNRFLYLVTSKGEARRYGVGVGKPGFEWAGEHKVTRKAEWPSWHPPAEMISREAAKGHYLPASMEGGPANPLGARAMYLGSTLYRIHGTNAPWTIGYAVSSGCIRMRNEDVTDLYGRVSVGTRVIVQ